MCTFGHLHTHSEYSTLDGMGKVRELLETAKSLGQDFIAITDHGSTSGLFEAQQIADELNMKIIHGIEFYYEREGDGENGHLLVLAKSNRGLENIFKMQQYSSRYNFYKKPRINWDILQEHSEGLIVTSACLGSPFNQFILNGQITEAIEWARKFQDVFGEDFYIELQPNSIPEQHTCNVASIRIAKMLGIKMVATNDVHYTLETDCFPHEVLLAMQFQRKMSDEKRFKFPSNDFWLKSEEEMYETFEGLDEQIVQEAIHSTREIADKCDSRIEKGHYLPHFYNIPEGKTERELLVELTKNGVKRRGKLDKAYLKDIQHEIDVIDRNGYSGYFLIVQDYVTSAKARGELVGEGRGSGAGSKVAYTTGITEIPPHEFDLLFERFMADGREPDFDTDFSNQQAVFEDLQGKYGVDNVSRIIAFGRMTPRAVIRKVFNCFGHSMALQSEITKNVPDLCPSLEKAYKTAPELLEYKKRYPTEWEVIERLENVCSHESQHAGGVLIYPNLGNLVPLKWDRDNNIFVATWDKYMLEALGHFKFDVLGLKTLEILDRAVKSVRNAGHEIDFTKISLEDSRVYDMLCTGDVSGVFQIAAQSGKVIDQQPRNFRDLIAINALIRPGVGDWNEYIARRQGKAWEVHPTREPYLKETEGLIAYQEQYLLDGKHLAGWDVAFGDKNIRKNKKILEDKPLADKFIEDCVRNRVHPDDAMAIWEEICLIVGGGYGFNKSHSASYAMLSYQTAYLKCYYPTHFYAALMSNCKTDGDGQNEIAGYIAECKQRGIQILPPDINTSGDNFLATSKGINYRITTIKHVGTTAIDHINELRPIHSFEDYLLRRDKSKCNKAVTVNLIKAGAFDFDNTERAELIWQFDMSQRTKTQIKNEFQCERSEWNDDVKMAWEMDVLGMYLSVHPMEKYGFKPLDDFPDKARALQGGEVVEVYAFHPKKDPKNPKMAWVTLNTLFGTLKVIVFARQYAREDVQDLFVKGNILLIRGTRSGREILFDSGEVLETKPN